MNNKNLMIFIQILVCAFKSLSVMIVIVERNCKFEAREEAFKMKPVGAGLVQFSCRHCFLDFVSITGKICFLGKKLNAWISLDKSEWFSSVSNQKADVHDWLFVQKSKPDQPMLRWDTEKKNDHIWGFLSLTVSSVSLHDSFEEADFITVKKMK